MDIDINEICNNRISYEINIRDRPMRKQTYILSHQKENFYIYIKIGNLEKARKCFLRIQETQISILDKIIYEDLLNNTQGLLVINKKGSKRITGTSEIMRQISSVFMDSHIQMTNLINILSKSNSHTYV